MLKHKSRILVLFVVSLFLLLGYSASAQKSEKVPQAKLEKLPFVKSAQDTAKKKLVVIDSLKRNEILKFKPFKVKAHASYYANKFNGKRTASGKLFDNDSYTAAHRKLPFGTKLKITNEDNGKSIIVEVTDRGPFSRGREIDLTRRAFMEITSNSRSGSAIVTIEIVVE